MAEVTLLWQFFTNSQMKPPNQFGKISLMVSVFPPKKYEKQTRLFRTTHLASFKKSGPWSVFSFLVNDLDPNPYRQNHRSRKWASWPNLQTSYWTENQKIVSQLSCPDGLTEKLANPWPEENQRIIFAAFERWVMNAAEAPWKGTIFVSKCYKAGCHATWEGHLKSLQNSK